MKIINKWLITASFLAIFSTIGIASRGGHPKGDLIANTLAMELQKGDILIDKENRKMTITGFAENGLISVNKNEWLNSLKYVAVAKGSRGGFYVGQQVYDNKNHRGKIMGFYADGKACWSGPDMRIKTSKLTPLRDSALPRLTQCKAQQENESQEY
jgi:hypothetical protein